MIRLADLMAVGVPADADQVQAEVAAQYGKLARPRPVSAEEHRAIGRACVDNEQRRATYEAIAPGPAAYQRNAILVYASDRVS
ncbi:TipAS antibiotic-recognition domain-containing protein [Streptomyces sp. NPDC018045]|uniref:TipAS antibiotic-recognition domain-containing protein n=1 Tax=Streptomyces sp. NPDC018045 TaxID=3365037 RepID=UPI00378C4EDA